MNGSANTDEEGRLRRWRRIVAGVLFLLTLALGLWVFDRKTTSRLADGPMVQLVRPDGFTVVWEAIPHRPAELIVEDGTGRSKRLAAARNEVNYEARVEGLPPSSQFRYVLVHRSLLGIRHAIAEAGTRTARKPGEPFRFLVFGDSGSGGNAQKALAGLMESYNADMILHVGDLVYQTGHPTDYPDNFYRPNAGLIRSVPFYPVLGNHDVITDNGRPMLDRFVLPPNGPPDLEAERCFTLDYADAFIVGVDSNLSQEVLAGQVVPWLETSLQTTRALWKFAFFHHPPYTGSRHSPEEKMRQTIVPVLERCGVDVAFAGHNHLFERTDRILEGKADPQRGIVYVVTGAGGSSKYPERSDPPEYLRAYNDSVFSFTAADVTGSALRLRQIADNGETLDDITLTKEQNPAGKNRRERM